MKRTLFLLSLSILLLPRQGYTQKTSTDMLVVILGAAHAIECNFPDTTDIKFMNHSVADFSSKQLLWTLSHGVIAHKPELCVLQTGGLDVLFGISPTKVTEILQDLRTELTMENISLLIVQDFPYWKAPALNDKKEEMDSVIRSYCMTYEIPYLAKERMNLSPEEVNPGNFPTLSDKGKEKFISTIIKYIEDEF